jgi:acetolactate synthase-1/2/3 large subunit
VDQALALLQAAERPAVIAGSSHGEHVTEPARIRPALERALASGTVACVNVMLDPEAPVKAGAMGDAV